MSLDNAKEGKLLYHLTKLENLESIIEFGLLPRAKINKFSDVANPQIIDKRKEFGLNKYTPFHFHPYSSFDVAVKSNYKNEDFVYICIKRDLAERNDFKILPKHPLSLDEVVLMEYEAGFKAIDWEKMSVIGNEDEEIKQIKMAECLTEKTITANFFSNIYVRDERVKNIVEKMLEKYGIEEKPPYVNIQKWV